VKVIIQNIIDGVTYESTRTGNGVTASEVLDECLDCMSGMGFHAESIKEAVCGKAEEIETSE